MLEVLFKLFEFKNRIGAVHAPNFFPGSLLAGGVDMALHEHALLFADGLQFLFQFADVLFVMRQQRFMICQFFGK